MNILPYLIVIDAKTGKAANISEINPDGSETLDFEKYGDLFFKNIQEKSVE